MRTRPRPRVNAADEGPSGGDDAGLIVERTTVVVCADWPVVALTAGADQPESPAATFHANRVVAVNGPGRAHGVQVGQRRREAQRHSPDLLVLQRDVAVEARLFEPVLAALDDITPRVEVEHPGWCSFATRGPSRYFGGDADMGQRVADVVAEALVHAAIPTPVRVGTADTRFAARLAARQSAAGTASVVPPDLSPNFLAPLSIGHLDDPDLVGVLRRLGLHSLGAFAELPAADVVARFGASGLDAHQRASGREQRVADPKGPPPDFASTISLDPPIERVDQAAFVAKTLAEEFCRRLQGLGAACSRVAVIAETEHGEELVRLWRGDGALSAGAIADRMRWQLDGWLNGSSRQRPTGGLSRLELRPDEVLAAKGRQLGFWGGETHGAERAARAVARVQGLLGADGDAGRVSVAEAAGGRSVDQEVRRVPAEAVDLVERAELSTEATTGRASAGAAPAGDFPAASTSTDGQAYLGRVPSPLPIVVFERERRQPLVVLDDTGAAVEVTGRGLLSAPPASLVFQGHAPAPVVAWAGPWLVDERWWDERHRRRWARLQVVTADGQARLVACERGEWFIEALYD